MIRIVRSVAVLAGVAALSSSFALAPVVLAADHAVDIAGFAFSPQTITISAGDRVTWSNADAQSHTATADDGSFDTGTVTGSTPKSVTFATAGTFAYHCKIHPSMTGTIVVAAATGTAPTTDTAAESISDSAAARPAWLVLAIAALGGVLLAARRFSRSPGQ